MRVKSVSITKTLKISTTAFPNKWVVQSDNWNRFNCKISIQECHTTKNDTINCLPTSQVQQHYHTTSQKRMDMQKFLVESSRRELGTMQNSRTVQHGQWIARREERWRKTAPQQWQMQKKKKKKTNSTNTSTSTSYTVGTRLREAHQKAQRSQS